jgi:hypothetical protein
MIAQDGRAAALAARFDTMNREVVAFVEGCPEEAWQRIVPGEGRSIAFLCAHIAGGYAFERRALRATVVGEAPPSFGWADLHALNDANWAATPHPGRAATLARLRTEGDALARDLRALGDADLARPITYGPMARTDLATFVETIVLGHPRGHLAAIQAAAGAATSEATPTDARKSNP